MSRLSLGMPIEKPPAPGEQKHKLGEEGTRQAKLWLDSTTRVRHSYTNMDDGGPSRLAFMWPYGDQPYSYDLGGVLRGKPFENDTFVAESKNYVKAADQGTEPPWVCWRLLILETRIESWQRVRDLGSRRHVGIHRRRKLLQSGWFGPCGRSWGPSTEQCIGSRRN